MASNFLEQWKKAGRKIDHSGFDVSGRRVWSMPAGLMLTPFFMETNPNEHFEIDVQGLMRTETMNTAAFVSGKNVTSLFFVPYSQIWHNYNSFVSQKDDRHSAAFKDKNYVPSFSLLNLYELFLNMYASYKFLWALSGFASDIDKDDPTFISHIEEFNGVSGHGWNDIYLAFNKYGNDIPGYDEYLGVQFYYVEDLEGMPYVFNLQRAIQFFRYGTPYYISSPFDDLMLPYSGDWLEYAKHVKPVLTQVWQDYLRDDDSFFKGKYPNLFRPAAYQHVFYDFFRNKFFDEEPFFQPNDIDNGRSIRYVETFNFDDLKCDTIATSHFEFNNNDAYVSPGNINSRSLARFLNLFDLHYRQYKHDIFTSAMNSTQFGAVSSVSFSGTPTLTFDKDGHFLVGLDNGQLTKENSNYGSAVVDLDENQIDVLDGSNLPYTFNSQGGQITISDIGQTSAMSDFNTSVDNFVKGFSKENLNITNLHLPNLFDVLSLRRAQLLQQWKQNALRAGNMVDDNFRQHYGVEPYYEDDNNVKFLGSFECKLDAKPITATASTGDAVNGQVGDLAAIGVGSSVGSKIRFSCRDFGTVIAVSYFLPDVFYTANGIDAQNTKVEPFDFYSEEFENIGFESLPFWTQSIGLGKASDNNLGFVPPYTCYKTNIDLVFGEFGSLQQLRGAEYVRAFDGSLRAWTLQREDLPAYKIGDTYVRDLKCFYVDPTITNSLFKVHYNGEQSTDPMHYFFNFEFKALRPMSVLGLPIFS